MLLQDQFFNFTRRQFDILQLFMTTYLPYFLRKWNYSLLNLGMLFYRIFYCNFIKLECYYDTLIAFHQSMLTSCWLDYWSLMINREGSRNVESEREEFTNRCWDIYLTNIKQSLIFPLRTINNEDDNYITISE